MLIFFCHPKTLKIIEKYKIKLNSKIKIKNPTKYKSFLNEIINQK